MIARALVVLALAGCHGKPSCAERVERLRAHVAAPAGNADAGLPITFASDGIGRTAGAFTVRVIGNYDQVSINGAAPRAMPAFDVVQLAQASGAKVIELEAPHDMTKVLGFLVGQLAKVGELHLVVAHVRWPHDTGSTAFDALEAKVAATDQTQAFYLFNDLMNASVAGACKVDLDKVAADARQNVGVARDVALRAALPDAARDCDCAMDVEAVGALAEVQFFPRTELGWLRVKPGPATLGPHALDSAAALVDWLAGMHPDGRAAGLTFPS